MKSDNYQRRFHQRWQGLRDPHVRSLAWLLDAPALLDADAPAWQGKIAQLNVPAAGAVEAWLHDLDAAPQALHAELAILPVTRLGRYAEKLMAFYFRHLGILAAHGVQVRTDSHETIGEFDFLLSQGDSLLHWELATKLYLLEPNGEGCAADYFVGPNLADTLGAKMRKIFERQLNLAQHPAAQRVLPLPVSAAQALVNGWLFYHHHQGNSIGIGVSPQHCRGFWCELAQVDRLVIEHAVILTRLQWLAPARLAATALMSRDELQQRLAVHFADDSMPVLVAIMARSGEVAIEIDRGFIVPDDWRTRASQRSVIGR